MWLAGGCASWYLDKHGHNTTLWPDFTFRFRKLTKKLDRENYVGVPASSHDGGGGVSTRTVFRRVAAVRTSDGAQLHAVVDGRDDAPATVSSRTAGPWPRPRGTTSPTCSDHGSPTARCG